MSLDRGPFWEFTTRQTALTPCNSQSRELATEESLQVTHDMSPEEFMSATYLTEDDNVK